jgi:hypothetical protein
LGRPGSARCYSAWLDKYGMRGVGEIDITVGKSSAVALDRTA